MAGRFRRSRKMVLTDELAQLAKKMAIRQLSDGRWICYYRVKGEGGKSRIRKEYFGRGAGAEAATRKRNDVLHKALSEIVGSRPKTLMRHYH